MFPCTVSQLTAIIFGQGSPAHVEHAEPVTGVTIDSRQVEPGEAFFAMPGSRQHGVLFADDAMAAGASCVVTESTSAEVVSSRTPALRFQSVDSLEIDSKIVRVANSLTALHQLAAWNRRQSSALVAAVTGSVGKTTTRQMIAAVLGSQFRGLQSPRNFNNEIGVPLSLLQLKPEHEFAVLELGAGRSGDIRHLTELCQPEFGIVTRVSAAHLATFGTMDAIRRTKQELVEGIDRFGTVFLNADDPAVCSMATATAAEIVTFGFASDAQIRASHIESRNGICTLTVDGRTFNFQGARHLATSALAAIAVGRVVGIADAQIADGLSSFQPDAGRGRIIMRSPWTVIDDSYNASPASVQAAVGSLSDWSHARHRLLVLGDMLELGAESEKAHYEIGRSLMDSAVDHALVFGQYAEHVIAGAQSTGASLNRISLFHDLSMLQTMLDCLLTPGDVVVVKGSRSMHMERVVDWLIEHSRPELHRSAA